MIHLFLVSTHLVAWSFARVKGFMRYSVAQLVAWQCSDIRRGVPICRECSRHQAGGWTRRFWVSPSRQDQRTDSPGLEGQQAHPLAARHRRRMVPPRVSGRARPRSVGRRAARVPERARKPTRKPSWSTSCSTTKLHRRVRPQLDDDLDQHPDRPHRRHRATDSLINREGMQQYLRDSFAAQQAVRHDGPRAGHRHRQHHAGRRRISTAPSTSWSSKLEENGRAGHGQDGARSSSACKCNARSATTIRSTNGSRTSSGR